MHPPDHPFALGKTSGGPCEEPAGRFDYHPANRVPSNGGGACCNPGLIPWGAMDQRSVEKRNDALVFGTPPLERSLEVTGPVEVHLFASTSAPDADWTAKLVHVAPDARAMNLADGIVRARYRNSLTRPELLEPGEVYEFVILAGNTSDCLLAGSSHPAGNLQQ